uniref:Uncharacterized protein n=1 Tax=Romanomermis culicivorax TaxID=13658 RepID=A0A915L8E8_ROMCU
MLLRIILPVEIARGSSPKSPLRQNYETRS